VDQSGRLLLCRYRSGCRIRKVSYCAGNDQPFHVLQPSIYSKFWHPSPFFTPCHFFTSAFGGSLPWLLTMVVEPSLCPVSYCCVGDLNAYLFILIGSGMEGSSFWHWTTFISPPPQRRPHGSLHHWYSTLDIGDFARTVLPNWRRRCLWQFPSVS